MENINGSVFGVTHLGLGNKSVSIPLPNASGTSPNSSWIIDSGASHHMTFDSQQFLKYISSSGTPYITVADGSHTPIAGCGDIELQSFKLKDVLHVPGLSNNLLSVRKITKDNHCAVIFYNSYCVFQDLATGKTIEVAKEHGGLYYLSDTRIGQKVLSTALQSQSKSSPAAQIWLQHKRLGHPPFPLMKRMFPSLFSNQSVESFKCDICQFFKHTRTTFPSSLTKSVESFDLIHYDVWGPAPVSNISGARWFVSFIDDCSRVTWIFLMNNKSEVPQLFIQFYNMVQTQFGKRIKRIRSDNGKEYVNHNLSNFTSKNGIIHEFTCVDTRQQNGVAERKNRHLLEVARAILFQMSVPKLLTATYLINRVSSRVIDNVSPIQFLISRFPSVPILQNLESRVFGCVAFVHVHQQHRTKLDSRAVRCIFVGYPPNKRGYKCYHPPSRKYFVSKDVTFHENVSYFTHPQTQGENMNENDSEFEFLIMRHNSHETLETPVPVPILSHNFESAPSPTPKSTHSPSPESTPSSNSESASVLVPPLSSVLQESTPIIMYQRRNKPDMVQEQIQSPEPEVSTESDSSIGDSHTSDTDLVDLPIALRKHK
jgi:transposase InsO family protein